MLGVGQTLGLAGLRCGWLLLVEKLATQLLAEAVQHDPDWQHPALQCPRCTSPSRLLLPAVPSKPSDLATT